MRSQRTFMVLVALAVLTVLGAGFAYYKEVQTLWIWLAISVSFPVLAVAIYYLRVFRVFGKIVAQMEALLAGNKYKKVLLKRHDEFGLLAKFFNHVTKNLESVSHDLKEGSRMMSELDLAAEIQKSVLPTEIPLVDKLDVAARTRPADEVGGDSFSFMKKGDETYIYLGDVTGHGAPAGLIMMMVNTLLHVYLEAAGNTQEWLVATNRTLKPRVNSTMFMTTVVLRWDPATEKMFYTGAGHEHLLVYRAKEGVCEAIASGGIALGMTDDISEIAQEKEVPLSKEDIIVLYTDGIPEARNQAGEMYTLDRLKDSIARNGSVANSQKLFEKLAEEFRAFVGEEPQLDDITLIVLRYSGLPIGSEEAGGLVKTEWQMS